MATAASKPEDFARTLLTRLNVKQPADIADLARAVGIRVREVKSTGFDGALVRLSGRPRGIIAVRASIRELGRKRFTIAHEIGHYILPGHGAVGTFCSGDQIEKWGEDETNQEDAANRFASEFLLPSGQVGPLVKEKAVSIETAKFVSNEFQTSLTAAALKCVEVTDDSCALVVSVDGMVRHYRSSRLWRYIIPVGSKLGPGTLAKQLLNDLNKRQKSGVVNARAWAMDYSMLPNAEVVEDSILLPRYNTVLSMLTAIGP